MPYRIYRSQYPSFETAEPIGTTEARVIKDLSARPGATYYYWISEIRSDGTESRPAGPVRMTIPLPESWLPKDEFRTLPGPDNATGTSADGMSVQLSWDPVPDAVGYRIYRSSEPSLASATLLGSQSTTTYVDQFSRQSYLKPGLGYYWIVPVGVDGAIGEAIPIIVTIPQPSPPVPVQNLTATYLGEPYKVEISFDDTSDASAIDRYILERSPAGQGSWEAIASFVSGSGSYTFTDTVPAAQDWDYRVRAQTWFGSESIAETTAAPPTVQVSVSVGWDSSLGAMKVTFSSSSPGVTHFDIERSPAGGGVYTLLDTVQSQGVGVQHEFFDYGADRVEDWDYRVTAYAWYGSGVAITSYQYLPPITITILASSPWDVNAPVPVRFEVPPGEVVTDARVHLQVDGTWYYDLVDTEPYVQIYTAYADISPYVSGDKTVTVRGYSKGSSNQATINVLTQSCYATNSELSIDYNPTPDEVHMYATIIGTNSNFYLDPAGYYEMYLRAPGDSGYRLVQSGSIPKGQVLYPSYREPVSGTGTYHGYFRVVTYANPSDIVWVSPTLSVTY